MDLYCVILTYSTRGLDCASQYFESHMKGKNSLCTLEQENELFIPSCNFSSPSKVKRSRNALS